MFIQFACNLDRRAACIGPLVHGKAQGIDLALDALRSRRLEFGRVLLLVIRFTSCLSAFRPARLLLDPLDRRKPPFQICQELLYVLGLSAKSPGPR